MTAPSSDLPKIAAGSSPRSAPDAAAVVSSEEVLRGQQELHIHHGDAVYTLRVTRQGKLILTK